MSGSATLDGAVDGLTQTEAVKSRIPDMAALLESDADAAALSRLRAAETIGHPLGGTGFVATIEQRTGRILEARKRGPKPQTAN